MNILKHFASFISVAVVIAATEYTLMSSRVGGCITPNPSKIKTPPAFTLGWNLSTEG